MMPPVLSTYAGLRWSKVRRPYRDMGGTVSGSPPSLRRFPVFVMASTSGCFACWTKHLTPNLTHLKQIYDRLLFMVTHKIKKIIDFFISTNHRPRRTCISCSNVWWSLRSCSMIGMLSGIGTSSWAMSDASAPVSHAISWSSSDSWWRNASSESRSFLSCWVAQLDTYKYKGEIIVKEYISFVNWR